MDEEKQITSSDNGTVKKDISLKKWGCLYIPLIIVIAIILMIGGCYLNENRNVDITGKKVVEYLDAKYQRKFVVKSGRYIWNLKTYEFNIYPEDNPDFTFQAWSGLFGQQGSIRDTYLAFSISADGYQLIRPYLNQISGNYYKDYVAINLPVEGPALPDLHKNKLTLQEILNKYRGEIEINIRIFFNFTVTDSNKEKVFKITYDLLKFLKAKGFGNINISFSFYDLTNQEIENLVKKHGINEFERKFLYNDKSGIGIRTNRVISYKKTSNDLDQIKSYEDISKFFGYNNFNKIKGEKK